MRLNKKGRARGLGWSHLKKDYGVTVWSDRVVNTEHKLFDTCLKEYQKLGEEIDDTLFRISGIRINPQTGQSIF